MSRQTAGIAMAAAWLLARPELALACAVCGSGADDPSRDAYLRSTIFMSLLPLSLLGGGVYWLYRAYQAAELQAPQPVHTPLDPSGYQAE